eukprot:TRINITY_DN34172_c0_g1_i5.p1 TRINITY_DN34172_c0_g1~~TRINITY_DN34172_c0_g1_i5.p1  ORF type:complete len:545 (+),score=75.39 TRINITY_DN34172_c0_g1_i5:799-2433(+)
MGPSTKSTRSLEFLGFVVVLLAALFRRSTAYGPHGALDREAHIMASSHSELGRNLLEGGNTSEPEKNLAATVRVDPLDKFQKYRGGYNISNKHYWSSTAFTGKYGYSIAALWLLGGLIYCGFRFITLCWTNKKWRKPKRLTCSRQCYFCPIILGVLFTFLAIIASGIALGGNSRFHSRAKTVMNIILNAADEASGAIYNVTRAIETMQANVGIQDSISHLNSTTRRLNQGAADIQRQALKNRHWINKGLKILYASTNVVVSLNLIAVLAMLVSGVLRLRRALYLFIFVCWFFTVICWLYFGVYFFIEKFAGDSCTALVQYQQDPRSSSLSSILPCDDLLSAKLVLQDAKEGIYDLIDQVNANISATPILNQVRICNPFSGPPDYNYQPETCSNNAMGIGEIPKLLERFTCSGGDGRTCREGEFISASSFRTILVYSSSIQDLMNAFPGMENLVDCQMVKDVINEILFKQCKPVTKYIHMVWAAMTALSTIMVILVLTWTTKSYHDRNNHSSDGAVKPQSATPPERLVSDTSIRNSKLTEAQLEV